jgi:hypothetical protein
MGRLAAGMAIGTGQRGSAIEAGAAMLRRLRLAGAGLDCPADHAADDGIADRFYAFSPHSLIMAKPTKIVEPKALRVLRTRHS